MYFYGTLTSKVYFFLLSPAPPSMVEVPGDMEVAEGGRMRLTCGVESQPPPLVYWTREGSHSLLYSSLKPLAAKGKIIGILADYTTHNVSRQHSGRYVCGAVNPAGGIMTRIGVSVYPSHLLPPPIISVPPYNQTLPLRDHATLTCRVWGNPTPKVLWKHDGKPVSSTPRIVIHEDNTLTIDGKLIFCHISVYYF